MKLRIIRKPTRFSNEYWYTAQVRRLGIWFNCYDDFIFCWKYSPRMLDQSRSVFLDQVESFVDYLIRGEEMYPEIDKTIVRVYET